MNERAIVGSLFTYMPNNKVTLHDVYELVDERTTQIYTRIDKVEVRVSTLEIWKADIMGKIAIMVAVASVAVTITADWFKKKLNL